MPAPKPSAAGGPLALLIMAGALVGAILGQPSIGVLVGVALGAALAVALWLIDRRRTGE